MPATVPGPLPATKRAVDLGERAPAGERWHVRPRTPDPPDHRRAHERAEQHVIDRTAAAGVSGGMP
ncbi:hypothetical protein [Embleya sp. NPDC020630]|uniref:hypothetical protein n=1 Tax=Embleya sp. NPDC020630 TaxID=3363979 RepID=UPI0037999007